MSSSIVRHFTIIWITISPAIVDVGVAQAYSKRGPRQVRVTGDLCQVRQCLLWKILTLFLPHLGRCVVSVSLVWKIVGKTQEPTSANQEPVVEDRSQRYPLVQRGCCASRYLACAARTNARNQTVACMCRAPPSYFARTCVCLIAKTMANRKTFP